MPQHTVFSSNQRPRNPWAPVFYDFCEKTELNYSLLYSLSTLRIQDVFFPIQSWPELLILGNYYSVNTSLCIMKHSWFQWQPGCHQICAAVVLGLNFCSSFKIACWDLFQIFLSSLTYSLAFGSWILKPPFSFSTFF